MVGCRIATTRPEFVGFLKELESEGPDTELLIVGDTFGSGNTTLVQRRRKVKITSSRAHQAIFDQLRLTGAHIKVTMMVGNHDYDLALRPRVRRQTQRIQHPVGHEPGLIRAVGDKKIWIEHGQQRDQFNSFP